MLWLVLMLALLVIGAVGGFFGSQVGLGGAVIVVPLITLFLGVPIAYAAGASLIAAIATSSGAASAYVKDRVTNIRIGMSLEVGTTLGAIIGAVVAVFIYKSGLASVIFITFGAVLMASVVLELRKRANGRTAAKPDRTTRLFQLSGSYYDMAYKKRVRYNGVRWWLGEVAMFFAGAVSGLLGIGSGALKVLALDSAMKLPTKVSTSTSNFMIGVTAAVGSAIYWRFGYIQPFIAGSIAVGVFAGAYLGSRVFMKERDSRIRMIFLVIVALLAVEMILKGIA